MALGLFASAWTLVLVREVPLACLVPLCVALVLGVADDWRDLPVGLRVLGELGAGTALAWAVPTRLGAGGWPLIVAVELLLVNGVNLLDGLDALAGSIVAASSAAFALLLSGSGRVAALSALGAVVGFLVFNRPPARIYLGDGGSYLLGTVLALLLVLAWSPRVSSAGSVAATLLVALPVAEVVWALIRRRRAGLALLAGDRGHSYDRLAARGWGTGTIALAAAALQFALGLIGVAALHSGLAVAVLVVGLVAAALMAAAAAAGFLRPVREDAG